jgi:kynurenine formamidase
MTLIDLSRTIRHNMQRLPNHPSIIVTPFATHDEVRVADGYEFTNATMALVIGDHAETHVDAPFILTPVQMHSQLMKCHLRPFSPKQSAWTCLTKN